MTLVAEAVKNADAPSETRGTLDALRYPDYPEEMLLREGLPASNTKRRHMIERIRDCMATAMKLDAAAAGRINEKTTSADVPGWTSVAHLTLVLELEKTFKIRFDNDEIVSLGSVAAIIERLTAKGIR